MFTGIIKAVAKVQQLSPLSEGEGVTVKIVLDNPLADLEIGESIAINGVCSTVTDFDDHSFSIDYIPETLKKTVTLMREDAVNLERSLALQDKMSGHFVTGHVDGVGKIITRSNQNDETVFRIQYPSAFQQYLISKGSITINGVSLTVVEVDEEYFTCHIIPHTLVHTNLQFKEAGDQVNLEFDMLAKYLHRFYSLDKK